MKYTGASLFAAGRLATSVIVIAALTACGGSGNSKKFTIGGTISGLTGTVVLKNNGSDSLSRNATGSFTFGGKVKKGKTYAVTVGTQPAGQTCVVTNGSGTATANVTNVTVTCTTNPTYSVGGSVGGLTGTVVLRNNGGDNLSVSANGPFTFATKLASGAAYAVTVLTQPTGQTCAVTLGTGAIASADVTNVAVTCTDSPPPTLFFSIGGTVTGLSGGTLRLHLLDDLGAGSNTDVTTNGSFSFDPYKMRSGSIYGVSVATQPAGQTCVVSNSTGTVRAADVTSVTVNCASSTTTYTIGGTITGLTGSGLTIEDGPSNSVTRPAASTTFTLPTEVGNGFQYNVGIKTQPTGQTCVLIKSHGSVNNANVTNVDVRCIANVTSPLLVGTYTVPALSSTNTSYVYITLFADGVYIYGSIEDDPPCDAVNNGNGVEYGVYSYDATTHVFTIKSAVVDTNGACGVWDSNGSRFNGTLAIANSGQNTVLTLTPSGGGGSIDLVPVESTAGQIIGSWAYPYEKNFAVFMPAAGGGTSLWTLITETQQDNAPTDALFDAGVEYGCASIAALTGGILVPNITGTCDAPRPSATGAWDTTGTSGLSHAGGSVPIVMDVDTLTFTISGRILTRIKPH